MDLAPQIFIAQVMHKRLFPRINAFRYRVWYVALPLPAAPLPSRFLQFRDKDHGPRNGSSCTEWARGILKDHGLEEHAARLMLVTMPRVLGYVFNPVSFYLCLDAEARLRAIICEVHNTFGEQHSYLCVRRDREPITAEDWLTAEKIFHVSPFLPREGSYRFRFALAESGLGIWIDYFDAAGNRQLVTSLTGTLSPLTAASLRHAAWKHPLVTLLTIALIHWQALKLVSKGIRYIAKPLKRSERLSVGHELTKW